MKRMLTSLFIISLLLSGCSLLSGDTRDSVLFYYPRAEYQMGSPDGTIVGEERDGTGHITSMDYLLRLYMAGPHDEDLVSPFPAEVQLIGVRTGQEVVTVTLSGASETLSASAKTLACACLTLTCLDISDEESVMIFWGDDIITMDRSCLTLFDSSTATTE